MPSTLLADDALAAFPAFYKQEGVRDPIVYAIFHHEPSNWKWYATEYDPKARLFFGLVVGFESEWGYFSLDELEEVAAYMPTLSVDTSKPGALSEVGPSDNE